MPEQRPHFPRASGVLLHPTSLPAPDGIGDLGESAFRFVDWLQRCGQSLWQVLPLGPTTFGDSPYQTLSAFAGNPLLISLDKLVLQGWLDDEDISERPDFSSDRVDFGPVITWKFSRLEKAWNRFLQVATKSQWHEFEAWSTDNSSWLDDFALFMALKDDHQGKPWCDWEPSLSSRQPLAIEDARRRLEKQIQANSFRQWLFADQWQQLRAFAAAKGIRFIGDLPIFVAYDSSDVWANPAYFTLDSKGHPTCVAGVPPDYFSKTGQLWGNPLYNWENIEADDYSWWVERMKVCLDSVDIVRIDHFRGFEAYWEVPADEKTAMNGRWVKGPGAAIFEALRKNLGTDLPVIAEDLGVITAEVEKLRDDFDLPGMKVLQFAWSGPDNVFLPHEHRRNCVVYSGTHDNDPTLGWWKHLADDAMKDLVCDYVGCKIDEPNWAMIRMGLRSPAHTFIATMQDVLGLGREARMNLPGEGQGNWNWRMNADAYTDPAGDKLAHLTWLYRRRSDQLAANRQNPDSPSEGKFV